MFEYLHHLVVGRTPIVFIPNDLTQRGTYKYTQNLDLVTGYYTIPQKGIYVCTFNVIHVTTASANAGIIVDDVVALVKVKDATTNVIHNYGQWVLNTRGLASGVVRTMSMSESFEFLESDEAYLQITPNAGDTQTIRIEGGFRLLTNTE